MRNHDRPDRKMRDRIDTIIRQLDDVGRHHAAAEMLAWGVPLPVIARVLHEPARRRPVTAS